MNISFFLFDMSSYFLYYLECNTLSLKTKESQKEEQLDEKVYSYLLRERRERCIESGTKHGIMEALNDLKIHNVPDRGP
jgi:hypothetical protein